jgi:hypothetical protein
MKNGKYTESDGSQRWYKDGNLHREDGPAIIYPDGTKRWYKDGKRHREDGPAIIYSDGTQRWYKNGKDIDIWANDRNIDLNNLSDDDKIILKIEIKMWK